MADVFSDIYQHIATDPMNAAMQAKGYAPVYTAGPNAKIVIVGQAPGRKATCRPISRWSTPARSIFAGVPATRGLRRQWSPELSRHVARILA